MTIERYRLIIDWTGMSVPHCCNCLLAAIAVAGINFDPETGVVTLRFPDGTEITATIPENKRKAGPLAVVADSQNLTDPPKFFTRAEWEEHLRRAKAGHFDYLGTDFMPTSLEESVERVSQLDLSRIVRLLTIRGKLQPEQRMRTAETLYRQFLILQLLYPNQQLVPASDMDEFLDIHSGATAMWRENMLWALGWVPDHDPFFGMDDPAAQALLHDRFDHTVALYKHHFGTVIVRNQAPIVGDSNPLAVALLPAA